MIQVMSRGRGIVPVCKKYGSVAEFVATLDTSSVVEIFSATTKKGAVTHFCLKQNLASGGHRLHGIGVYPDSEKEASEFVKANASGLNAKAFFGGFDSPSGIVRFE